MTTIGGATTSKGQLNFANPRLEAHMTFVCPECGKEYESQQLWRRHLNEEHDYLHKTATDFDFREINEGYHECQICHKWVANANQAIALLQYHRFLHLPFNRTYRCRHCKGGFSRKRALCEHLYRFHSRQIVKGEKQRRSEKDNVSELRSLRDPSQNPEFYMRFLCPQCGISIDRFEQWLQHLETHACTSTDLQMHHIAGSNNHYCLLCKKLFYTSEKVKLQRHRFSHMPFKMYFKCAFCLVKKSLKSELFRHFAYAHPGTFSDTRAFIQKPVEWGGKITYKLNVEIDAILKRNKTYNWLDRDMQKTRSTSANSEQTDLIKKALQDSLIDLETEYTSPTTDKSDGHQKSANEYALDQSLQDLEAILKMDAELMDRSKQSLLYQDLNSNECDDLDALCDELFEEVVEEAASGQSKYAQLPTLDEVRVKTKKLKEEQPKDEIDSEPEEKIISIEIYALNECDQMAQMRNYISPPPRKRLKLSDTAMASAPISSYADDKNDKYAMLLEQSIHYICPECGSEFKDQNSWRSHVFSEHNLDTAIQTSFQMLENQNSYLCLDCMAVQHTTKFAELQRHRFMHMPFQAYLKCTLCHKTKSSKPKMLQHLQQYHQARLLSAQSAPNPYKCNSCQKVFRTLWRWRNHRTNCLQQQSATVKTSNSNIANNLRLLAHLKRARVRLQQLSLAN